MSCSKRRSARAPDAIAVLYEDRTLSYGELNRRANQLAHHLRALGVGPDEPVAICLQRSFELVIGVLGILKAGGAYVPLDPEYPAERLAYMLEDSAARVVLTQTSLVELISALPASSLGIHQVVLDRDEDRAVIAQQSEQNPALEEIGLTAQHLAYIIYTSGSTGRPKGIEVTHRPVINLIRWVNERFEVGAKDTLLFVTSICFDLSVYDIFGVLAAGAKIRLADERMVNDPEQLARVLCDEGITFWDSAPAALQLLVPYIKEHSPKSAALRLVFNSGDWIPLSLPPAIAASFPQARFISLGGATEATVLVELVRSAGDEIAVEEHSLRTADSERPLLHPR